ncbi:methionine ABC transporter ATP-binding protein [Enterococcus sp. LJL128]|uniref:methionine ABC transporter ATP-binding protein n=1 Tax=Enterococcus sp. LJL51 TaxID=3416656 RepID=UPI003CF524E8
MTKIEVNHLTVAFNQKKQTVKAVDDVSFQVKSGEIFGIIGLSGAGKSTLIRTLNLLQLPSEGTIKINGEDITTLNTQGIRKIRQKIGMIFQHFNLIQNRTIAENIAFSLKAGDYPKDKQAERIDELLKLVDLADKKHSYPNNLSGGQKQRIGIARALANDPEILLCDEATSALDVETTEEILKLLEKINQEMGITIVFITHELEVAKRLFQRIAVMENGKIVEQSSTFELFAQPQSAIAKKLVSRFFNLTIPNQLKNTLNQGTLLELRYQGTAALDPLISEISKKFDVLIGITHGKIEYIQNDVIGILFVYLTGTDSAIAAAVAEIQKHVHSLKILNEEASSWKVR